MLEYSLPLNGYTYPMTKEFKEVNKKIFYIGCYLPFDVLVYIEDHNSFLLFQKGQILKRSDIEEIKEHIDHHFIIKKSDYEKYIDDGRIKLLIDYPLNKKA